MNICVIGKYPPIEGGVSMENYWLCRGLAERGHSLRVVTNAAEVESSYRMSINVGDREWLEPSFPSGGRVQVRTVERFSRRRMGHIPGANPFVSKLASVAAQEILAGSCDIVFAYYFEPYGVAGHLASKWTSRPFVVKHAGSDLDRLMGVPDLAGTYIRMCREADSVVTRPDLADRFMRMGVDEARLALSMGFDLPPLFSPDHPAMDVEAVLAGADPSISAHLPTPFHEKMPDPSVPVIGIYGKVGELKGSFDLLAALRMLKDRGQHFSLLCMVNGLMMHRFVEAIDSSGLAENTWLLPFTPHWRVPGFIRACTAVCFLERDFSIAIHGPTVPREVMACGTCLIVSGEIAKKQQRLYDFQPGETALVVADPKNHESLAAAIEMVIANPDRARAIGLNGRQQLESLIRPSRFVERYERLFLSVATRRHDLATNGPTHSPTDPGDLAPLASTEWPFVLNSLLPWTSRILRSFAPQLFGDFRALDPECESRAPVDIAARFRDYILLALSRVGELRACPPYLRDVLLLESVTLNLFLGDGALRAPFSGADRLGDSALQDAAWSTLRPESHRNCVRHTCKYDLSALNHVFLADGPLPDDLPESPSAVLIVPLANCSIRMFRLDRQTSVLLDSCDGTTTGEQIAETFLKLDGVHEELPAIATKVRSALIQLYSKGVIIFL